MTPEQLDAILAQDVAILGRKGSGKTFAAKGFVERLLDQQRRVCIVDPTGVWHGLRTSADGKAAGYPVVIFGGERGDVRITDQSGERLAAVIAERNMPAIVDISEFSMGERHRFMQAFLAKLHAANRRPLHLIVDEADEIAPQNPMPETKRVLHEIDRIVRRGRVKGFRVMLITQRPAVLHKNVLSQASTLIAMRLMANQDRDAINAWVEAHADRIKAREVIDSLPTLSPGEGWVWSPELDLLERTKFPAIRTFDSSRTPEEGDDAPDPEAIAALDLGDLQAQLVEEQADEKPGKARKATAPDAAAAEKIYREGVAEGRRIQASEDAERLAEMKRAIDAAVGYLAPFIMGDGGETPVIDVRRVRAPTIDAQPLHPGNASRLPKTPSRVKPLPGRPASGDLHAAGRAILAVLAQRYPARFTWTQAATLAGLRARGGHFNAGRKDLRDRGLLIEEGDLIGASERGLAESGVTPGQPAAPGELLEMWCGKLDAPAPEMLRYLASKRGRPVSREELAAALGKAPHGGHWNNGVSQLRNNGLAIVAADGLRAAGLFVDG